METENSDGTQTTITQGPSGNRHILHVRQDSASELEAMFNTALNPNFKSKSLPMIKRNLPKSFFQQPDRPKGPPLHGHSKSMLVTMPSSISHSRSSSTDSSASHHSNLSHGMNNVNQNSSVGINQGVMGHRQSFTPGPSQRRLISQNKVNNVPQHANMQVMPAHSRSKSLPVSLNAMNANMFKSAQLHTSGNIEIPPDMPLPTNWEMAKTPDGQCYFMNHNTRTTTWEDPRLTILKEQQQQQQLQQQQNRSTESSPHHSPMHAQNNINANDVLGALPPGWEQAMTPQGEVYFINHETRSTSWLDPRLPQANINTQAAAPPQMTMNTQLQQQVHKMNQLDIGQQAHFGQQPPRFPMVKQLAKDREAMLKMRLMKQVGTGMDPFLGSGSSFHEREQSCDSGVGGMGTNYSPLRVTEDYLGHVEEMDTGEVRTTSNNRNQMNTGGHSALPPHPAASTQQRFPDFLDGLPSSNVDFSRNGIPQTSTDHSQNPPTEISGEDPTIVDDSDFMNDVESILSPVKSENIDTLTWL